MRIKIDWLIDGLMASRPITAVHNDVNYTAVSLTFCLCTLLLASIQCALTKRDYKQSKREIGPTWLKFCMSIDDSRPVPHKKEYECEAKVWWSLTVSGWCWPANSTQSYCWISTKCHSSASEKGMAVEASKDVMNEKKVKAKWGNSGEQLRTRGGVRQRLLK